MATSLFRALIIQTSAVKEVTKPTPNTTTEVSAAPRMPYDGISRNDTGTTVAQVITFKSIAVLNARAAVILYPQKELTNPMAAPIVRITNSRWYPA
jgi:hypothetical protein